MQTIQLPDDIYQRLRRAAESEYREPAGQIAFLVDHYCAKVSIKKEPPKNDGENETLRQTSTLYKVLTVLADLESSGVAVTSRNIETILSLGKTKTGRLKAQAALSNLSYRRLAKRVSGDGLDTVYKTTELGWEVLTGNGAQRGLL